jgi:hypothetical protein
MRKEIEDQFDAALSAHERKLAQRREAQSATEKKEREFLQAFDDRCVRSLKPTLEQIGQYLAARGIRTRIEQTQERIGQSGRKEQDTALVIYLAVTGEGLSNQSNVYPSERHPHFRLICDKTQQRVVIFQSTMGADGLGQSGEIGTVGLEELTPEFIEEKLLYVVKQIL